MTEIKRGKMISTIIATIANTPLIAITGFVTDVERVYER